MKLEFTRWESDGRFGLSQNVGCFGIDPPDGSLGTGASNWTARFGSAEARTYYERLLQTEHDLKWANHNYEMLAASLRHVLTPKGRVRRKKLNAILESLK